MLKRIAGLGVPMIFLLPVIGFITSLCNIRSKTSAFVYVTFAALLGYAISFSDSSADSYRYARAFSEFDNALDYNALVNLYRSGELRDLYRVLLFYFTSIFSSNPKVMFAFAGVIYGILSYKAMIIFIKEAKGKYDLYVFILVLIFYTYVSLSNINGFRFWTGGVLLFCASYKYIIENQKLWLLGLLITPLFHYGFILMIPVLLLYSFISPFTYSSKGVNNLLFFIFVVSFFGSFLLGTNSINLGFLTQSDALSGAVGSRLDYVNSEDVASLVESRREGSAFLTVRKYFDYGIKTFVFITILYLRRLLQRMTGDKTAFTKLFAFVLYFYTFAFIATSFPSGTRFLNITHLFLMILLVKFYVVYTGFSIKKLILWALSVFSFNIAFVNFMLPYLILSSTFWYGNIFWILIEGWGFRP